MKFNPDIKKENKIEEISLSETISGEDLFYLIYKGTGLPQDKRFLPTEDGGVFRYFDLEMLRDFRKKMFFSVVKLDNKIVAMTQLRKSPAGDNVYFKSFTSVDPEFQEKGYASKTLEECFKFAKEKGITLENSSYNTEGYEKLQKKNIELAERYGVNFIDGEKKFK